MAIASAPINTQYPTAASTWTAPVTNSSAVRRMAVTIARSLDPVSKSAAPTNPPIAHAAAVKRRIRCGINEATSPVMTRTRMATAVGDRALSVDVRVSGAGVSEPVLVVAVLLRRNCRARDVGSAEDVPASSRPPGMASEVATVSITGTAGTTGGVPVTRALP